MLTLNGAPFNLGQSSLSETKKLDTQEILNKICVSNPYFSFNEIFKGDNFIASVLAPHQPLGLERSKITIGEAGRHLAILGTCLLATAEVKKFYYLVEKAVLVNSNDGLFCEEYEELYLVVMPDFNSRRKAGVTGFVMDKYNNILYNSEISFNKLTPALFSKFFKNNYRVTQGCSENPYGYYLDIEDNSISDKEYIFSLKILDDNRCAGHFENCPSIPTAFFVYNIIHAISHKHLNKINRRFFSVLKAKLNLFELMFPDTHKTVEVSYTTSINDEIDFYFTIFQDGVVNGEVEFSIKVSG